MCIAKTTRGVKGAKKPSKRPLPSLLGLESLPERGSVVVCEVGMQRLSHGEKEWAASRILGEGTSGGVYLGSANDALNEHALRKHGITHIINATVECGSLQEAEASWSLPEVLRIPVKDSCDAPLRDYFYEATQFINSARAAGGTVLIHCRGGVSRSSTLCAAYLMLTEGLSSDAAFDFLREKRSIVSPNIGFLLCLEAFEDEARKCYNRTMRSKQAVLPFRCSSEVATSAPLPPLTPVIATL